MIPVDWSDSIVVLTNCESKGSGDCDWLHLKPSANHWAHVQRIILYSALFKHPWVPALFSRLIWASASVYDSSGATVLCYSDIPSFHSPVAFDSPTLNFHFSLYTQTIWISTLLCRALQFFTNSKPCMTQAFSTRFPRWKTIGLRYVFLYASLWICALVMKHACGLKTRALDVWEKVLQLTDRVSAL